MINHRYFIIFLKSLIIIGFVIAIWYVSKIEKLPILGEKGHKVGTFSFVDQNFKRLTDQDVKGKIRVVEFFFTSCTSICPVMNQNLLVVYNEFKNRNDFVILSHTVNPEKDDSKVLYEYAEKLSINKSNWFFLTGDKYKLYKMASNDYLLGVDTVNTENIQDAFIHTPYIALIDKKDQIRGFYNLTKKENLKKLILDIKKL